MISSQKRLPTVKEGCQNKLPVIDLHSAMDGMPGYSRCIINEERQGDVKAVYDAIKIKKRRSRRGLISKRNFYRLQYIIHRLFVVLFRDNQYFCSKPW